MAMAFLRIKPVRKRGGKTYYYVYEVESYKHKGKVRQRTLQLLGPYVKLEKQKQSKFPINKALQADSKKSLLREIFAHNLANYGFIERGDDVWRLNDVMVNLRALRVFHSTTNKDIYLSMNDKFFGTYTLKKAIKSDSTDLVEFVKSITASGALDTEEEHDRKLLQVITSKFKPMEKMPESSFEEFAKKVGY